MLQNLEPKDREQMVNLLKATASANKVESDEAQKAFAAAIQVPLRMGNLIGDTISDIFNKTVYSPNARIEYPIDFYRPDNFTEFAAYVIPSNGKIPQRQIEGDYVTIPTYKIGSSIDWLLRYSQEANWDVVGRALRVLEAGFVKKINDDAWHTILAAGFDRNIVVSDSNAAAGQLTKRLLSLGKLVMRRNGGGNSSSVNRSRLTHLFVSPEAMEDIRNWGIDEVDEITRREIFVSNDEGATQIFGVKIVALDELGEGQEYQLYYQNVIALGAANNGMAASDVEIAIGLDADNNDSFVMPIREELQVFEDPTLHRSQRQGYYAWEELGIGVLSNARVLLLSL